MFSTLNACVTRCNFVKLGKYLRIRALKALQPWPLKSKLFKLGQDSSFSNMIKHFSINIWPCLPKIGKGHEIAKLSKFFKISSQILLLNFGFCHKMKKKLIVQMLLLLRNFLFLSNCFLEALLMEAEDFKIKKISSRY